MGLPDTSFLFLADAILVLHFVIVLFVVGGLVAVLVGGAFGWTWVRRPAWRLAHLAAIGYVVVQQWLGATCPLTTLEAWLRIQSGQAAHAQGFIEHWLQRLLFYSAPGWVFTLAYSAFALAVAATWFLLPPRRPPATGG
jgi:hypothetical protein